MAHIRSSRYRTYQVTAICFALILGTASLEAAGATTARGETRVALVVGNGSYARDPLANPPRDAKLMAHTLRRVGFDVILVVDGDRQRMQSALVDFSRRLAAPDSIALFYYAGHGVQVSGENYLLPVDVDIRAESEVLLQGINLNEILVTLNPSTSRLAVAVLDACRNNPFVGLARGLRRGLAAVTAPAGTLIAFSTAPGEVALDGNSENSPYTAALAQAIPIPGLPIEEVFKRTRQSVMRLTGRAQVPWEHSSLIGRFVFAPAAMAKAEGRDTPGATADIRLVELNEWERIKRSQREQDFVAFLEKYPSGAFAELARYKLNQHGPRPHGWSWWLPKVVPAARPLERPDSEVEEVFDRALRLEAENKSLAQREEARSLYRVAANAGWVPAMYRLARTIEHEARRKHKSGGANSALQASLTDAAAWYKKAAEKSHSAAERSLGRLYEFGEGVPRNLAEALRLYRLSATAGDAGGMASLGFLYATGKGVERDIGTARTWYAKAAANGSERAMFNLAILHLSRDGGELNIPAAAKWLSAAAKKGHAAAMRQLAILLDQGHGINRDTETAASYLLQAYAAGDTDARNDLFENSRRWSRSTRRAIQQQLKSDGLYAGAIHGTFNSDTRRALSRYSSRR